MQKIEFLKIEGRTARLLTTALRMRSSLVRMRSSLVRMRYSLMRMRSSLVVRASDCQCTMCNGPGFDPSIRRHSGSWGAADEAVPNIVRTKKSIGFLFRLIFILWRARWGALFLVADSCRLIGQISAFSHINRFQWFSSLHEAAFSARQPREKKHICTRYSIKSGINIFRKAWALHLVNFDASLQQA